MAARSWRWNRRAQAPGLSAGSAYTDVVTPAPLVNIESGKRPGGGDEDTAGKVGKGDERHSCAKMIRKLDTLPEEKIYQILDYIDFLESKYAPKPSAAPNPLKRFAEGVEDTLRAGKMSANVIGGTMNVMNKAVGVVTDVANAGKSVATEIAGVVSSVASSKPQSPPAGPASAGTPPTPPAQTPPPPPPGDQRK